MGIVIGLLILSSMMIVHELGHYLTGRRLGFKIEEFSLFMGPVLFSWERKGIKYSLKALPIGASVRFAGEFLEQGQESSDPGHFFNRPKWARSIVIATGPALNLLTGVLAFLIMFSSFGYTIPVISQVQADTLAASAGLEPGDRLVRANNRPVRTTLDYSGVDMFTAYDQEIELEVIGADGKARSVVLQPRWQDNYRLGVTIRVEPGQPGAVIEAVEPDSNRGQPVLQPGDVLLAAAGIPFEDSEGFRAAVAAAADNPLELTIIRNGAEQTVSMISSRYRDPVPRGIMFEAETAFLPAIGQSFQWSWSIVKVTVRSIGMMFSGALRPQDTLSGPVGVVTMIGDVVSQDQPLSEKIYQLLWMFALISVSLGFMNLLPIPPLDGNHLVLIAVEAVRGRRLSAKIQNLIGIIGIGMIIALALIALMFDIMRLTGR